MDKLLDAQKILVELFPGTGFRQVAIDALFNRLIEHIIAQQAIIDKLRAQNAIQAEQLDRLADAVPSAGAHADNCAAYLKEQKGQMSKIKYRPDVFQGQENHPQCCFFDQLASSPDPYCDFFGIIVCYMDESEKSAEQCKGDYLKCPLACGGKYK